MANRAAVAASEVIAPRAEVATRAAIETGAARLGASLLVGQYFTKP